MELEWVKRGNVSWLGETTGVALHGSGGMIYTDIEVLHLKTELLPDCV